MWIDLFLFLLLGHLIADFALQTTRSCQDKSTRKWHSPDLYVHTAVVTGVSWLVSWDLWFWWCSLVIGISHFAIDLWKTNREDRAKWFVLDQLMHLLVLAIVSWIWTIHHEWTAPFGIKTYYITIAVAVIACWKPANIFIKLILKHYSVSMPEDKTGFNAGALIGTVERWLILIFMCLQRYDALGLLIAAKSIIRFSDRETDKTEYVLAGTLLSILIAVIAGLGVFLMK